MNVKGFETLFSCRGYSVEHIRTDGQIMQVNLGIDLRFSLKCPYCNSKMTLNRINYSFVRDIPFGAIKTVLIKVPTRQGRCFRCHKTCTFKPDMISISRKTTDRLLRYTSAFCQYMPVTKVAQHLEVSDNTVRRWNMKYLKASMGEPNMDNLRYLLVDEKSIGKGHSYVTVVLNALSGKIVHMSPGKKYQSLQCFFDKLTDQQKTCIKAVCVDRAGAYTKCIKANLPDAHIAYDKFHLVKNLNDVISRIRIDLWNNARRNGDRKSADIIKGQKYNLLRNRHRNNVSQQNRLNELLRVNAPLSESYVLLESFKYTLSSSDHIQLRKDLLDWIHIAGQSCRNEIRKFAKNIHRAVDNIANAVKFKLNNGLIENFNRKIAMVIRRSCGCKNLDYLFLNLRQLARKPIPL